jgi:phosphopantothenoylcysteine decarboxylase/phosphopantothenate--cysteine ligase
MSDPRNRAKQEASSIVLITAGPTQEPIDAVRYLANRSTGRMGIALAEASAQGLLAEHWPDHGVLIMAAAVADYRPAEPGGPSAKHKRRGGTWNLQLEATPDLLGKLAAITRPGQLTVGFALEPADRLLASAREKLAAKNLDAIVANPLETIGSERIEAMVVLRDGRTLAPPGPECTKRQFAEWLLDQLPAIKGTLPSSPA